MLSSLSWYANEITLRYPGVQRHGSEAGQALMRGRASRVRSAGPRTALTRRRIAWVRQTDEQMQEMTCDAEEVEDYIIVPLQVIRVIGYWSRKVAQRIPMVLRAVATRATPAGFERQRCW